MTGSHGDPEGTGLPSGFVQDLEKLLNHHGIDSYCGVPDYLLARYLVSAARAQRVLNWNTHLDHTPSPPGDFVGRRTQA